MDLNQVSAAIDQGVRRWAADSFNKVQNSIKLNLTGGVLHVGKYPKGSERVGGNLLAKTEAFGRLRDDGFSVGTNVWYGKLWELGSPGTPGMINYAFIVPNPPKKALRWFDAAGNAVFSKWAFIPPHPTRPFIKPAITENEEAMKADLNFWVSDALNRSLPTPHITITVGKLSEAEVT